MDPTYSLPEIQRLIRKGTYSITVSAQLTALELGLGIDEVCACVQQLDKTHFYKTMSAEKVRGLYQDVYKINYFGIGLYIKVQLGKTGRAIIISFKEDTS